MEKELNKERLFTTIPVTKAVFSLAIPTVIAQLITVVYNIADTFFIGRFGDSDQVAAATLAMPLFMLLTAFSNLFGIGGSSLISRCLGIKNHRKARQTSTFCIFSSLLVSFSYGIVIILFRNTVLPIIGTNNETFSFCSSYIFWSIGIGAVPTVLNIELSHLIRSEGYSSQAGFGVALGGILNIILDPILIHFINPAITGAAIATMLSNIIATLYFFTFLFKIRKKSSVIPSLKALSLGNGIPFEVLSVGLPAFVMTLMSTLSNFTLNKIISEYSNEAVAGMGIAKKIDLMAFAIAQGMSQGTLPLIAYNYSSKNIKRMKSALKILLFDSLLFAICAVALMFFGATLIIKYFINDGTTIEYGRTFLRILSIACPTTALNFLAITVFQATGRKIRPLILSMLRKGCLDIPLMFLLNNIFGIKGIAWATPLADEIAFIITALLVIPYLKRLKS